MWVPAPRPIVDPQRAGVDPSSLTLPEAFSALAAPPIFITGSARSGTNWTLDVFGQHPEVCGVTETWILSQTHGLTSVLSQDEWDPAVSDDAVARVGIRHAAVQLLPYEQMARELGALLAGWLMRAVRPGQRFLVAKEPLDVGAAAVLFRGARVIHVVRDGRDVAVSMRRAAESWDPSMVPGLPMSWRAEAWRRQVENARAYRDLLGDRYLEIRYEDLRRDVGAAASRLFEFSGIPYDDAVIDRIREGTRLSSYSETVRKSGFRGPGEVGGWRAGFTLRDAVGFARAAGDLLVELGYESDTDWWRAFLVPARRRRSATG